MNVEKKKALASKTLGVGKRRILFNSERISEIKEAITRQDIRDLYTSKAILIKEVSGRKKKVRRKTRRRLGTIKKQNKDKKREYINLTRKLRSYVRELLLQNKINKDQYYKLRKQIKASMFRSKAHLKELMSIQDG